MNGITVLVKEAPKKSHTTTPVKGRHACKRGNGSSPGTEHANAFLLDFATSRTNQKMGHPQALNVPTPFSWTLQPPGL